MTNLTKRALADALKELLSRRTLDRITVQDVSDAANVSRKTFYYHFHDIYDLMEWLVVDECSHLGNPATGAVDWVREVADALNYAQENRGWVLNVYQSVEREQLERILRKIVQPYVEADFDRTVNGRPVDPDDRAFAMDIYTYGLTGLFLNWVGEGMQGDTVFLEDKLSRLFRNSLEGIAERCVRQKTNSGETN